MRQKCLLLVCLFVCCSLSAQEAASIQPKEPDKPFTLEIKFDGPDAAKIKSISIWAVAKNVPDNQAGFPSRVGLGSCEPKSPGLFEAQLQFGSNAPSSEYNLEIHAYGNPGEKVYLETQDFKIVPPLRAKNNATFIPPKISVQEKH